MTPRRRAGTFVAVETAVYAGQVHVREDGPPTGRPVVLLHGFSGSLHWFDRIVPLLPGFRLIRVDLLGHGCTVGPAVDAPEQATMVDAVLDKLGVVDASIVGHSFGADVAVELAERSGRVDRLVIVCQAPDYGDASLPRGRTLMTMPVIASALHRVAQRLGAVVASGFGLLNRYPIGQELARQALLDFGAMHTAMFRVIVADRRDRMAARPLDAQVRAAGRPTLVIAGGRDGFYGVRYVDRYRAAGARVVVLDEAGHSPLVEAPGRTGRVLHKFLQEDLPA